MVTKVIAMPGVIHTQQVRRYIHNFVFSRWCEHNRWSTAISTSSNGHKTDSVISYIDFRLPMSSKSSSSRGTKRSADEASLATSLPAGDMRKIVAASRTQKGAPRNGLRLLFLITFTIKCLVLGLVVVLRHSFESKAIDILQILQKSGLLETTDSARYTQRLLTNASRDHSTALTVYGRVVQTMQLPGLDDPWEYVEPKAYLRYMSSLSDSYAEVMNSTEGPTNFNVILYLDEICPGNPFRPDKARKLWSMYWACLEWPSWLIARSGFWPILGLIKSSTLNALAGGEGMLWKCIMQLFKGGIRLQIVYKEQRIPISLTYKGTLADEAALKAVNDFKGASGIRFCMEPLLFQRHHTYSLCLLACAIIPSLLSILNTVYHVASNEH